MVAHFHLAQQHKQAATKWTHRRMRILNKIITLNTDFELQVCVSGE